MTARTVTIEVPPGRSIYLYGQSYVIHPVLRLVRSPRQYDPKRRAIAAPKAFLDDIMAAFELQTGVDVTVEQVLS